jgi:hypothetical protein
MRFRAFIAAATVAATVAMATPHIAAQQAGPDWTALQAETLQARVDAMVLTLSAGEVAKAGPRRLTRLPLDFAALPPIWGVWCDGRNLPWRQNLPGADGRTGPVARRAASE